jgi:hypothetical protein
MVKSSPQIRATSLLFQKIAKVNNRPLGENSPNLVTLIGSTKSANLQQFNRKRRNKRVLQDGCTS